MSSLELASPKFIEQTGRPENQVGVDSTVLCLKFTVQAR